MSNVFLEYKGFSARYDAAVYERWSFTEPCTRCVWVGMRGEYDPAVVAVKWPPLIFRELAIGGNKDRPTMDTKLYVYTPLSPVLNKDTRLMTVDFMGHSGSDGSVCLGYSKIEFEKLIPLFWNTKFSTGEDTWSFNPTHYYTAGYLARDPADLCVTRWLTPSNIFQISKEHMTVTGYLYRSIPYDHLISFVSYTAQFHE